MSLDGPIKVIQDSLCHTQAYDDGGIFFHITIEDMNKVASCVPIEEVRSIKEHGSRILEEAQRGIETWGEFSMEERYLMVPLGLGLSRRPVKFYTWKPIEYKRNLIRGVSSTSCGEKEGFFTVCTNLKTQGS